MSAQCQARKKWTQFGRELMIMERRKVKVKVCSAQLMRFFSSEKKPLIRIDIRRKLTPLVSCHFLCQGFNKFSLWVMIFSDFTNTCALDSSMVNQRERFDLPKKLTTCIPTHKNHLIFATASCETGSGENTVVKILAHSLISWYFKTIS